MKKKGTLYCSNSKDEFGDSHIEIFSKNYTLIQTFLKGGKDLTATIFIALAKTRNNWYFQQ